MNSGNSLKESDQVILDFETGKTSH